MQPCKIVAFAIQVKAMRSQATKEEANQHSKSFVFMFADCHSGIFNAFE